MLEIFLIILKKRVSWMNLSIEIVLKSKKMPSQNYRQYYLVLSLIFNILNLEYPF